MSISEHTGDLAASTATNGWANVSGSVYGFIDPYWDSDWFKTYLVAGVTYQIQMLGIDFDAYLVLRNGAGSAITFADAGAVNDLETITYTPTLSGFYYLDTQSFRAGFADTGFYLASITSNFRDDYSASTLTSSNIRLNVATAGTLELQGDADWHGVSLTSGQTYTVSLGGSLQNGYVQVFDSIGLETGIGGTHQLTFTPTATGTYFIEVSGNTLTDVGTYSLTARELPTVSIDSVDFWEGHSLSTPVSFSLMLSAPSPVDVSVNVDTVNWTAFGGYDYHPVHRTVTIPAGQTSVPVEVEVIGNTNYQPNRVFEVVLSNPINAAVSGSAWGVIKDDDAPPGLVLPTDPLLGFQWHLYAVRAGFAWALATGKGVKVGVFDQGVDATNPDLQANTNLALGVNASNMSGGGLPVRADDLHGTYVAGVIASARDGVGLVGVAYDSTVVPIYSSLALGPQYLAEIVNAFNYAQSLDVLNNSWGFGNLLQSDTNWAFLDNAENPAFAPAFAALKDLATLGREGLGTVVVQSAGNAYSYGDDTNLHNFQNSRYVITVGSTDFFGQSSVFSTTGASILVSAPGGNGERSWGSILTTDRTGAAGGDQGDAAYVDGTSFSAPIVSGVVALMLEANPRLGYRDVQQILAYTARKSDVGNGDWMDNAATNWNGGGMHYQALTHATGFGHVDALAAVRLAASWSEPALTAANTKEITAARSVNTAIPDNSGTGLHSTISIAESMVVERVDVTVNIEHSYIGDLSILLMSPAGTTSFLMYRPSQGALDAFGSSQDDVNFTFDTVLNWGESSQGNWLLGVYDDAAGDVGTLIDWKLTLVGRPDSRDDVYVYTNEYPDIVLSDPARGVLVDEDGGKNTLNAGALGLDNRFDLSGRTDTILNGTKLTIGAGTIITTAIGGEGNDVLIASDHGSTLRGMWGNDTVIGGPSVDVAVFGANWSDATMERTTTGYRVTSDFDGMDTLAKVERLKFNDISIALDVEVDESAGQTVLLLGAALPGQLVFDASKQELLGAVIGLFDDGYSLRDLSGALLRLPIWDVLTGLAAPTNRDIANYLLTNVNGSVPDQAMLDAATRAFNTETFQGDWFAGLAGSAANQMHVGLVGLMDTGLEFVPQES